MAEINLEELKKILKEYLTVEVDLDCKYGFDTKHMITTVKISFDDEVIAEHSTTIDVPFL